MLVQGWSNPTGRRSINSCFVDSRQKAPVLLLVETGLQLRECSFEFAGYKALVVGD